MCKSNRAGKSSVRNPATAGPPGSGGGGVEGVPPPKVCPRARR